MTPITRPSRFVLHEPARHLTEAFLLGNGSLGAAVRGSAPTESFALNVDTLWSGGPTPPSADSGREAELKALRQAIDERDHELVEILSREFMSRRRAETYQPVGTVTWRWADVEGAYSRLLDLAVAEVETRSGDACLRAFVSAPAGVLVATSDLDIAQAEVGFTSPHPLSFLRRHQQGGTRWVVAAGRAPAVALSPSVEAEDPVQYSEEAPDEDGTVAAGMGWAVAIAVTPEPGGGARLTATAVSGFRGWDRRPVADVESLAAEAVGRVSETLGTAVESLRREHVEDYRELFDRVELDLSESGTELAELTSRYFDLGRYLLISSSRPGTQAANLQGIWNDEVRAGWGSNYTVNINTGMNYWGAEAVALPEMHEPLLDMLDDLAVAGRASAQAFYGSGGAVLHHNSDIWRFSAPVLGKTRWSIWPTGFAWLAAHLTRHLEYASGPVSQREKDRARRVRGAAAEALLDLLVEDGQGQLVVSPSTSPEHAFLDEGVTGAVTSGTTMDQELAFELLADLVAHGPADGSDPELLERARSALDRLRMPTVDDAGRIQEWWQDFEPAQPGHRHLSHLYGMFPGNRITPEATPELVGGVRRALHDRMAAGSGYTGWSQAWVLALAARLNDPVLAERALGRLVGDLSSTSLLDLHPFDNAVGAAFQIDGNLGAVAGIAELLVQSPRGGPLRLLPTLPASLHSGSVRGLRTRGGHLVDLRWRAGQLEEVLIVGGSSVELVLDVPDAGEWVWRGEGGPEQRARLDARGVPGRAWTTVPVRSGRVVEMRRA